MALVSWVVDFCIAICLQGEAWREGREGWRDWIFLPAGWGHEQCRQTRRRQRQVTSEVKGELLETVIDSRVNRWDGSRYGGGDRRLENRKGRKR